MRKPHFFFFFILEHNTICLKFSSHEMWDLAKEKKRKYIKKGNKNINKDQRYSAEQKVICKVIIEPRLDFNLSLIGDHVQLRTVKILLFLQVIVLHWNCFGECTDGTKSWYE